MKVRLPAAPANYSQADEQRFRGQLENILAQLLDGRSDIRVNGIRLTFLQPDGTERALKIDNAGNPGTEPYP